jgi:hypothetical protein
MYHIDASILLNIEIKQYNWRVFIVSTFITTYTNFNHIHRWSWKLNTKPRGRVGARAAASFTLVAIPERVVS